MKNTCLLLFILSLLTSCEKTYHKFDRDFPDFHWKKSDSKAFPFSIATDGNYNLTIELSHFYDYPFADMPLSVLLIRPDGTQQRFRITIPIRNEDGKPIGECALDICDLNFNIKNCPKLTRGNYKIVISNAFNGAYLPSVIGVGLSVEHS